MKNFNYGTREILARDRIRQAYYDRYGNPYNDLLIAEAALELKSKMPRNDLEYFSIKQQCIILEGKCEDLENAIELYASRIARHSETVAEFMVLDDMIDEVLDQEFEKDK